MPAKYVIPAVPEQVFETLVFLGVRFDMPHSANPAGRMVADFALADANGVLNEQTRFAITEDNLAAMIAADPMYAQLAGGIDAALRPFAEMKAAALFPAPPPPEPEQAEPGNLDNPHPPAVKSPNGLKSDNS
jgi:hypothetical protein